MDDILSFERKLSKLREVLNSMDWTPDGTNVKQGYKYLTHTKIKGNMSRALVASRLEWEMQYSDLQFRPEVGAMSQHYILQATATIFDIDNPEKSRRYTAFGEAADSGDKGTAKAQTNAFKNILANNFMLSLYTVEEEDRMEVEDSIMMGGGSKYEAKKESAKNAVLAKNPVKIEQPAEPTKDVPKVEEQKEQPTETKVKSKETETSAEPVQEKGGMSRTQAVAMEKIMNKITTLDEATLMPFGTVTDIGLEYNKVLSDGKASSATEFINKYKGVMALL